MPGFERIPANYMSCLTDYIGIKYPYAPTPPSGYWINQLPGISTEFVDAVADCEQVDFTGMWSDVQERAYNIFTNNIISKLAGKAKFEQEIYQTKRFSANGKSIETLANSPELRGCFVRLPESKYTTLYIKNLIVYSNSVESTFVRVYDTQDGTQLYSQGIDLVQGINIIEVEQTFAQRYGMVELFVGIDCTDVTTINASQPYFYYFYDRNRNECACGLEFPEIIPATVLVSDSKILDNIDRTGTGKGVWIDASVVCSIDEYICSNKKMLLTAWWYLLGIEILEEKINGYNLNYFSSSNTEQTKETIKSFTKKYEEFLNNALDGISVNGDNVCFDCVDVVGYRTVNILP